MFGHLQCLFFNFTFVTPLVFQPYINENSRRLAENRADGLSVEERLKKLERLKVC
jgi:hypothetical protein